MPQWSGWRALGRGSYGSEGLAKWTMVTYGAAGSAPIRTGVRRVPEDGTTTGVGTDAPPTRSFVRTFPKMGTRLCRSI
jgi:hypothetical protein